LRHARYFTEFEIAKMLHADPDDDTEDGQDESERTSRRLQQEQAQECEHGRNATRPHSSSGRHFLYGAPAPRQVEHHWLSDNCATQGTLAFDRDRGVVLAALPRPSASVKAVAAAQTGIA
jgi:hypothetical protein